MTVRELIEDLETIEDKEKIVKISSYDKIGDYFFFYEIDGAFEEEKDGEKFVHIC
jgi:hypothetical protein